MVHAAQVLVIVNDRVGERDAVVDVLHGLGESLQTHGGLVHEVRRALERVQLALHGPVELRRCRGRLLLQRVGEGGRVVEVEGRGEALDNHGAGAAQGCFVEHQHAGRHTRWTGGLLARGRLLRRARPCALSALQQGVVGVVLGVVALLDRKVVQLVQVGVLARESVRVQPFHRPPDQGIDVFVLVVTPPCLREGQLPHQLVTLLLERACERSGQCLALQIRSNQITRHGRRVVWVVSSLQSAS